MTRRAAFRRSEACQRCTRVAQESNDGADPIGVCIRTPSTDHAPMRYRELIQVVVILRADRIVVRPKRVRYVECSA